MEKQATERTRKTRGARLIHIRTHQGTRFPGDRLDGMLIERLKHVVAILTTSLASKSLLVDC